jgi:hypothetical protein
MVPLQVEVRDGPDRRFALRMVMAWCWAVAVPAPRRRESASSAAPATARHRAGDGGRDLEDPKTADGSIGFT